MGATAPAPLFFLLCNFLSIDHHRGRGLDPKFRPAGQRRVWSIDERARTHDLYCAPPENLLGGLSLGVSVQPHRNGRLGSTVFVVTEDRVAVDMDTFHLAPGHEDSSSSRASRH